MDSLTKWVTNRLADWNWIWNLSTQKSDCCNFFSSCCRCCCFCDFPGRFVVLPVTVFLLTLRLEAVMACWLVVFNLCSSLFTVAAIRSGCRLGYSYNQPFGSFRTKVDQNRLPLMLASAPLASAPSNAPPEPDGLKPRALQNRRLRRPKKTEQSEQDPAVWWIEVQSLRQWKDWLWPEMDATDCSIWGTEEFWMTAKVVMSKIWRAVLTAQSARRVNWCSWSACKYLWWNRSHRPQRIAWLWASAS